MYQVNKTKLPFQDKSSFYLGDDPDIAGGSLDDYIKNFITKNILFSPEKTTVDSYRSIKRFDTSFLEAATKGGTPEQEFFDSYVVPFLKKNGKEQSASQILNYYKKLKALTSNGKLKKMADLKTNKNSRDDSKSFRRKYLVDPRETIDYGVNEWGELARDMESEGSFVKGFDDIQKVSLKDIKDFSDMLRAEDLEDIENIILDLENDNRKGGASSKKSVPVKLSISDINDINQKPFSNPLDYYTVIDNIPLETEVDVDLLQSIIKDENYYPNKEPIKRELDLFTNLSDNIDIELLDVPEDTPVEDIYRSNQSNEGSVYDEANKFEQNFSVEDYMSYLKDPNNIIMGSPDSLKTMRSNADKIVEIPRSIFTAKVGEKDLDKKEFSKGITSEASVDKRTAFDSLYNSLDQAQQENKIYIGSTLLKGLEKGNVQSLRKYFVSDENGNIDRISESGLNKALGRGIRYEHVVPIKVLGELVGVMYDGMQESGNFNKKQFSEDAQSLVSRLYTIAWIDRDEDDILTKSGLRETMGPSFMTDFAEMLSDGTIDDAEESKITKAIFSRYKLANIQQNTKKLNDVFGSNKSIALPPIKNKDLRPKIDPKGGDIRIRESKKPVLTNLLFGYYG